MPRRSTITRAAACLLELAALGLFLAGVIACGYASPFFTRAKPTDLLTVAAGLASFALASAAVAGSRALEGRADRRQEAERRGFPVTQRRGPRPVLPLPPDRTDE